MSEIKKENNLMSGKGEQDIEWITANGSHIPIKDGESKQEAVDNFINDKQKQESVERLINSLKQVSKVKMRDLATYIKNLKPVKLIIKDNEIIAQFDKFSANKNVYTRGNSSPDGFNYKLNNVDKLPNIIETSQYTHTTKEKGKKSIHHKGVKEWHYFVNQIDSDTGKYDVVVNVRDKGENKYIYEIAITKKKV